MKTIKHIVCSLFIAMGLTGCEDFFDTLPMNEVVLENFWTDKNDVTSVVNSCYESLETEDCLVRMGIWGELRSDNLKEGSNPSDDIRQILKENILPSNPMCNWLIFYQTINRCNTVCYYAPHVQAIDPNYTLEEMRANIAEASAIRALCYFYLIRTFRDVPYTTQPSIDDSQPYVLPATPFNDVLDSLITDLESVKDYAVRRYYLDDSSNAYQNSSRITRVAIWAILADLYLWRGDWDNCIKYCDLVLDFKRQQYEDRLEREGTVNDIALFGDIPMILEKPSSSMNYGHSYNAIFGKGNSFESLFELYFESNQPRLNEWVGKYYGGHNNNQVGHLSAPEFLRQDVAIDKNLLFDKLDGRSYSSVTMINQSYYPRKYYYSEVSFNTQSVTSETSLGFKSTLRGQKNANWIFYRLSDAILMKAEALIQRGNVDTLGVAVDFQHAFLLINTVNKRAINALNTRAADTLKMADYVNTKVDMENLLLDERQREFLFEGKRWFDLVRFARRDNNNIRLSNLVIRKYTNNMNAIKIKLANPDRIYFPYAKNELKVNRLLKQNPAYADTEYNELTTNK
ncbi:MAG: RagB/SusD family nutrient uptake outer membrane protein [Bacteroidaceae bacterium]|nr:RagB/SusD family nutrient uptake outer membrane protein [Bacteroidaceae bacterium]